MREVVADEVWGRFLGFGELADELHVASVGADDCLAWPRRMEFTAAVGVADELASVAAQRVSGVNVLDGDESFAVIEEGFADGAFGGGGCAHGQSSYPKSVSLSSTTSLSRVSVS